MMNKKGYMYSVSIILLVSALMMIIMFQFSATEKEMEDTSVKIRCDELHYLTEDVKIDMERALFIAGRRAAIYAISNQVISDKNIDGNYTFTCNQSECEGTDCSRFNYRGGTGAEAAITELMVCGTLFGKALKDEEFMKEHTLGKWIEKMNRAGNNLDFEVDIGVNSIKIEQYDAWNFVTEIDLIFNIEDEAKMCYVKKGGIKAVIYTSIDGIEDPLYAFNTNGIVAKRIENCERKMHASMLSTGSEGWGWTIGETLNAENNNASDPYGWNETTNCTGDKILVVECVSSSDVPSAAPCLPLGNDTINSSVKNCGGIITQDNTGLSSIKKLQIPYLTGVPNANATLRNMTVILDGSQFHTIDPDIYGVQKCGKHIWINQTTGACDSDEQQEQLSWFNPRYQMCRDEYPAAFLFSNFSDFSKIAPHVEPNNTWNYTTPYPMNAKALHIIASSEHGDGNYIALIHYGNKTKNVSFRVCHHSQNPCPCSGSGYDCLFVSKAPKTNDSGAVFENVFEKFENSTTNWGSLSGQTVEHIIISLNSSENLTKIEIHDPYNESDAQDRNLIVFAVTIETDPKSVWKLNMMENSSTASLFTCYSESDEGPSFFDRLEGNYRLSDKYKNQTEETLGLMSFVNIRRLSQYNITTYPERTAVDYLYFEGGINGVDLKGTNDSNVGWFRMDIDNILKFGLRDIIAPEVKFVNYTVECLPNGSSCFATNECCNNTIFRCIQDDLGAYGCSMCLAPGESCKDLGGAGRWDWCCNYNCVDYVVESICCTPTGDETNGTSCTDGIDNDCDGKIDCADPPCNSSPDCLVEICNDNIDNDGDNDTDCADSECLDGVECYGTTDCSPNDGCYDQDENQGICSESDTSCIYRTYNDVSWVCSAGICVPGTCDNYTTESTDNDADGFTASCDLCDDEPGLNGSGSPYETPAETTCDDNIDNDCDGDKDNDDSDCFVVACPDSGESSIYSCSEHSGNSYWARYTVYARDPTGTLIDVDAGGVTITVNGNPGTLSWVNTGTYDGYRYPPAGGVNKDTVLTAVVTIHNSGCSPDVFLSESRTIKSMPSC